MNRHNTIVIKMGKKPIDISKDEDMFPVLLIKIVLTNYLIKQPLSNIVLL
jgi:hypothetical protein